MWLVIIAIICLVHETTLALSDGNVLTSPNFPNNYPANTNSEQTVSVPDGYHTWITFQEFQLETSNSCGHDYLQICDENKMICGQKLCGTSLPGPIIFSASTVKIVFHSDGGNSMKGLRLSYKKVKSVCSENVEISEDCVCSNTVCEASSTCVNGTTCTPACNENEKLSEECMCSNELCGVTFSCINGTTCMPACAANAEISEDCVCSNEVCGANHICASGLTCAKGWEQVTDLNDQIPEFLFDCLTKKDPWITPCSKLREYLMIFDSQGKFFQENTNKRDNSKYLSTFTKKVRIPSTGDQIIELDGHPNYLFQLEGVNQKKGTFYIGTNGTGSGQLLVAGNEVNPSLLLREDHCGKDSSASVTESPVTAIASIATALPDPSVTSATTVASTESPVTAIASIATASTEPSVTIANITTLASTESAVTNITTVASTVSPTTAIAISTTIPNMDYGCDQSQWRLWKVDRRFLLVESVTKPGFFLSVNSVTRRVQLGKPEKFTGIYTSFISHITLDRSDGRQAEPGIGAEAYGDLVLHYFGRDGSQHHGYICDYEWAQVSADAVCKHLGFETGIPTYDGRYSSTNTPEYVASELICDSENLEKCKVRTICGTSSSKASPSCAAQNSIETGKGFSCNRGSSTDVAGVVCGDANQIKRIIKEEISCDNTTLAEDEESVASMFNIHKQIKKVSNDMFENKHWSEYLLPMPLTVSLMSALLLVSSRNDRDIELTKPSKGTWDYLKFDNVMPNIVFLSHNIKEDFLLSNNNMGIIKINTKRIHTNMQDALQNAFSSSKYDYKTVLPRNLKRIENDAKINEEKAAEVQTAFKNTNHIIDELITALTSTRGYHQNKKVDTEKALNITKTLYEHDQKEHEEKMLLKQQYDTAVDQSRKAFFDAATEAMNAQCVNENSECNNCTWIEPKKTDDCKEGQQIITCLEWDNPICLEQENKCVKYEKTCLNFADECIANCWYKDCCEEAYRCQEYHRTCSEDKTICKKYSNKTHCKNEATICLDNVYIPEEPGSYCQDSGKSGLCTRCKWIDEVSKNLKNVAAQTKKLQQSFMNDESSYSGVKNVIEDLVSQVSIIDQDIQNYQNWTASSETASPIYNASIIGSPIDNATKTMTNVSESSNLKSAAERNIFSTLKLIKHSVDMNINLLSPIKIPIAKKTYTYAISVNSFLDDLITLKRKKVEEMSKEEKDSVATFVSKGKEILKEANDLQAKYEVAIKKDDVSISADHKAGKQAIVLLENLTQRHKTEKKIESLSNRMSNAIREMFKTQVEKQDINSIITKLAQCSFYLNYLNEQWAELRIFFGKLTVFLKSMHTSIKELNLMYRDLGAEIPRNELSKKFKTDLQIGIISALANNIFVRRIAYYYTKIAEDEVITKMASIGSYMDKIEDSDKFNKLKQYIEDKSISIQEKIKLEVSKEEARISDRILQEITSIKNEIACQLENAVDLPDESYYAMTSALNNMEQADNSRKNVLNAASRNVTEVIDDRPKLPVEILVKPVEPPKNPDDKGEGGTNEGENNPLGKPDEYTYIDDYA